MPEFRKDPLVGRWVIISVERAKRPDQFKTPTTTIEGGKDSCPFCEGKEGMTPPEIRVLREGGKPNGPGWRVRVVPNKFPALGIEGDMERRDDGVYELMNGIGAHEVIVESPEHLLSVTDYSQERLGEVLWSYKERLGDLKKDPRLVYGLIFKNVGERAGASLEHVHSQLICTPIVPLRVRTEMKRSEEYFQSKGQCLLCDVVKQEQAEKKRVVEETENFISFAPFASRFPFETHLLPKQHESHYEDLPDKKIGELAYILQTTIRRIEIAVENPPYNYLLHTSPLNSPPQDSYHWHFEIIPRVTRVAGFEWGSGFYINPVPPEHAAQYLREVKLD